MRLSKFIGGEVSVLLPFLSSLEEVSVFSDRQLLAKAVAKGNRRAEAGDEVHVTVEVMGRTHVADFFQMHGAEPIPPHIKNDPQTPRAVRQMDKANYRLSLRLRNGKPVFDPEARFHVYFPTEEPTGLGLTVHGDFFVKPDRTRLMSGAYNNWLMELAARKLAGDFLTWALAKYEARSVFEALRGASAGGHDPAQQLQLLVSQSLKARSMAFVPSRVGLLKSTEVAIPSSVDAAGFWDAHFSESLSAVTGRRAFLDPKADSEDARKFLRLAGMEPLPSTTMLDLIDGHAASKPSAQWWFEVYSYLAKDRESSRWGHDVLAGRRLLPDEDLSAIPVPEGSSPVVCLPPADDATAPHVPRCFRSAFVFFNAEVSRLLHFGPDDISHWVLHACRIARFEASDLLPRAIRGTVQSFYDGAIGLEPKELAALWVFLQKVISLSRGIVSQDFWQEIGRLPVPSEYDPHSITPLAPQAMMPASLAYWPDRDSFCSPCMEGVNECRRVSPQFVPHLVAEGGGTLEEWKRLLESAGVSGGPKLLRYVRRVGKREIPFTPDMAVVEAEMAFTGESQHDQNVAVVGVLRRAGLWPTYIAASPTAADEALSLLELSLIDGLEQCVALAESEWQQKNPVWQKRLWSLVRTLPISNLDALASDRCFRRARSGGGSPEPCGGYVKLQLSHCRWIPTTLGPSSSQDSFLRMSTRRLVSRAPNNDEIGDTLVPYLVAEGLDDYVRLTKLGIAPLEDTSSAQPATLVRFLEKAGERLQEAWARDAILNVRSRWRLVRGAIQEAYRALNQPGVTVEFSATMKLAARVSGAIEFRRGPLYYAEPGSAIERAFCDVLALIDADRAYQGLFERLGVVRLQSGQTVEEEFCGESRATPSSTLRAAIVDGLGPYLLAVIITKSEDRAHRDLVLRRLRERFDVQTADRVTVKYKVDGEQTLERLVDFPAFYLRRRLVESTGAVQETHYTLYVVGPDDTGFEGLDGDALGDAIAPVFFDGTRDDHSSVFPRIVARYQGCGGDAPEMERFLFLALGVPREAQELARDDLLGRTEVAPPIPVPEPPPAQIVSPAPSESENQTATKIGEHKGNVGRQLEDLMDGIGKHGGAGDSGKPGLRPRGSPTREQEVRGKRGEEEFLRRVQLPGGWMGFIFKKDTRSENVGYDFVCLQGPREVRVEVKTFSRDGRVILSANELRAASQFGVDYYLVGFLDEGSETKWISAVLQNPLPQLLGKGSFNVDVELQARAADVFDLGEKH